MLKVCVFGRYIDEPKFMDHVMKMPGAQPLEMIESLKRSMVDDKPKAFADCVVWARQQFQELFHNQISQLLYNFPKDQVTTSGAPFWSGPKRCPHPCKFFDVTGNSTTTFLFKTEFSVKMFSAMSIFRNLKLSNFWMLEFIIYDNKDIHCMFVVSKTLQNYQF